MSCLFLITARGGSKGVPRKNLQAIGGLSLIGWKARAAQQVMADYCGDAELIISTEDPEIAEEAMRHGVKTPFMRPAELASDEASSADVIAHAMEWIETNWGRSFDQIMLLEPSSPFATALDFRDALVMSATKGADLIAGMRRSEPSVVFIGTQPEDAFITPIIINMRRNPRVRRRQDIRPEWTMNGALYLFSWEMFKHSRDIYGGTHNYGLLMDEWRSIEIDTPKDLEMARYAFQAGHVSIPVQRGLWLRTMDRYFPPGRNA